MRPASARPPWLWPRRVACSGGTLGNGALGGGLGEGGAAAVEFALVGPMFLGLIAVLMIFSAILFLRSVLEGAVRDASRYGITGGSTVGLTREERIRQIIEARTYGLLDTSSIELETLIYERFDQVGQPEPYTDDNGNGAYDEGEPFTDTNGSGAWEADMGTAGVGGPNDIVVYRVSYDWGLIIPMVKDIFGAEAVTLRANIAVRNEPFPS